MAEKPPNRYCWCGQVKVLVTGHYECPACAIRRHKTKRRTRQLLAIHDAIIEALSKNNDWAGLDI